MLKILGGILMLGVLVFVHELGHFLVAKWCRVKVLKFSLGFGPKLFSRTLGETEYKICLIPLGGYVQMLGEGNDEEALPLSEEDKLRSFAEKPVLQRLAIVAAGPVMNLVLPFVFLPLAFFIGMDQPAFLDQPACIGHVVTESPADRAGLAAGDCILKVGGVEAGSWSESEKKLLAQAGSDLSFLVARNSELFAVQLPADASATEGLRGLGVLPKQAAVIGYLEDRMPAASAGLQLNDRIVSIDGNPLGSWYDIPALVQAGGGKPMTVVVERSGVLLTLQVVPLFKENAGGESGVGRYMLGVGPKTESVFKRYVLGDAFREGAARGFELVDMTLLFLRKLFAGHVSAKNIGGPIMVVQMAGSVAESIDIAQILSMLAFLSIQLGILNLLPVPILDGGHLLFGVVELVRRKPLSEQAREVAQQIGLVLLILLMAWAFYNDIMRLTFGG
ncbi:membrane-associated zinc metalloprotease RseP [Syntrophotalea carbinolica DSM 2380]|uniref:Zinc metalloprotease n=1 Tax=Syntrophotalea carbinolica (strain DSM 2380 / NBRC 103641 / GraBd1) TaxID=338963 RepID=Q3A3A2_SYNC1|nr:RIP metalloprotease RseP [Syntrophotalea carbinolica]ABA89155.1 membrane-associated zinc metalloprotease RseP [Syntrophotalea carbinolica DSM 2380]